MIRIIGERSAHAFFKPLGSLTKIPTRALASAQAQAKTQPETDPEWETAKPFEAIPRASFSPEISCLVALSGASRYPR